MRGLKILVSTAALLAGLAIAPAAQAQISIDIGAQPACSYGYYGYAPYQCAPMGYYGSGYFYNGVFIGMGPWSGYGYNHGWGGHRFVSDGGGRYHGGAYHHAGYYSTVPAYHNGAGAQVHGGTYHSGGSKPNAGHRSSHGEGNGSQHNGGGGQSHGDGNHK